MFHHLPGSDSKHGSNTRSRLSARVREIARDALKLSEVELDDFFEEEQSDSVSTNHVLVIISEFLIITYSMSLVNKKN